MLNKADALIDQVLDDCLERGLTMAQSLGIDDDELEALYTLGHQKYENGEYENAKEVFALLCRLHPLSARNFCALGSSLQMSKHYKQALDAYTMVLALDIENAEASLHAGECMLLLDMTEPARQALTGCIMQAQLDPEKHKETMQRASSMLAKITPSAPSEAEQKNNG